MTTTTLPFTYTSARPTAEQATERDSVAVLLDLTPLLPSLIPDIARAIARHPGGRYLLADVGLLNPSNPRYGYSLHAIGDVLGRTKALQVVLDLEQAELLADELAMASESPPECVIVGCGYYAQYPDGYCAPHLEIWS